MAKYKKQKEKEVLFDIMQAGESAQGFFEKNQNILIGIFAALLVIIGGFFGYKYLIAMPKAKEAITEMYKAEYQFEQDSFELALENPGDGYLGFLDFIDEYGSTPSGNLANYYAGISYLKLGRYEAAIEYLKDFSPIGEFTPILKFGALADAYSELEDYSNAKKYYQRAVEAEDNDAITPYYLYKLGMLHRMEGDREKSQEYFDEIKEDYPTSIHFRNIEKYLE